ncbi:MAG: sigma 54-interacting transcriptional regulator [Gammaproteobacteria bacterium]|nr:sigma 54-interacting transcriptional regulator [Gammaproteobacteria bacterium]
MYTRKQNTNEFRAVNHSLLIEVSKLMAKPYSSAKKIRSVLELLSKWVDLHFGRVLLPNNQTSELEVAYSYGLDKEKLEAGQYNVKFSQGLTGYVWRSGQVALVTDVMNEPVFIKKIAEPIQGTRHLVGFMSVPIIVDGKPVGVLSAQRRANPRRRYSDDIDLLRIIAAMIGPVIQRMQLRAKSISYNPALLDRESVRWVELCEAHGIIGSSKELLYAVKTIENVKDSQAPILLLGESGTGKELFASMTHKESKRRRNPFVSINCAAIPESLLESELFGHEKGSFTGAHRKHIGKIEQAEGGTLFLDEIGDMPLDLQAKLLRVLQDKVIQPIGADKPKPVDFRIITATHVDLGKAIQEGKFRLDLFYRLNVIPIALPALRERKPDIPRLAEHFLSHFCQTYERTLSFSQGVYEVLSEFRWPGNIRQLQNVIERAILQAEEYYITPEDIERILSTEIVTNGRQKQTLGEEQGIGMNQEKNLGAENIQNRRYNWVDASETEAIMSALAQSRGNQTKAAKHLGYTLRQLRYRLKKLGLKS